MRFWRLPSASGPANHPWKLRTVAAVSIAVAADARHHPPRVGIALRTECVNYEALLRQTRNNIGRSPGRSRGRACRARSLLRGRRCRVAKDYSVDGAYDPLLHDLVLVDCDVPNTGYVLHVDIL